MKNIKKNILQALTLSALVIIIVACSSRWDSYYAETENTSAYDLLKAQADFSEFLKLIEQNQLDYLLKDGVVTVFAPANGTFNTTGLSEIDLKNLLRQHIASGRVTASNASGTSYFASNGAFLIFDASFAKVNGVSISLQGTQKSGSIVHKVASLMNSSSKETLYGYLRKNKALYGYLYSLFDAATFDEKASVKYSVKSNKPYKLRKYNVKVQDNPEGAYKDSGHPQRAKYVAYYPSGLGLYCVIWQKHIEC